MNWDAIGKRISQIGPTVGLLFTAAGLFLNVLQTAHNEHIQAADLTLRFDDRLSTSTAAGLLGAAEADQDAHILKDKGGKFEEVDLTAVLGDFDTLYYLREEGLLNDRLVYDVFCPGIETVHDNKEVQAYLKDDRATPSDQDDYAGFDKLNVLCLRWDKSGRGRALAR